MSLLVSSPFECDIGQRRRHAATLGEHFVVREQLRVGIARHRGRPKAGQERGGKGGSGTGDRWLLLLRARCGGAVAGHEASSQPVVTAGQENGRRRRIRPRAVHFGLEQSVENLGGRQAARVVTRLLVLLLVQFRCCGSSLVWSIRVRTERRREWVNPPPPLLLLLQQPRSIGGGLWRLEGKQCGCQWRVF